MDASQRKLGQFVQKSLMAYHKHGLQDKIVDWSRHRSDPERHPKFHLGLYYYTH